MIYTFQYHNDSNNILIEKNNLTKEQAQKMFNAKYSEMVEYVKQGVTIEVAIWQGTKSNPYECAILYMHDPYISEDERLFDRSYYLPFKNV